MQVGSEVKIGALLEVPFEVGWDFVDGGVLELRM